MNAKFKKRVRDGKTTEVKSKRTVVDQEELMQGTHATGHFGLQTGITRECVSIGGQDLNVSQASSIQRNQSHHSPKCSAPQPSIHQSQGGIHRRHTSDLRDSH